MAQAPMAAAAAPNDPMAGATDPGMAGGGDETGDQSSDVIVTIVKTGDGSYMVYAGDEPDADADDAPAGGGPAPPPQGTPADSVGAALKAAMDILQADASSAGAPGSADDQMAAGYNASTAPTPASGPSSKY